MAPRVSGHEGAMPSGLVLLLDDVAALTKLAAASLDDVSAAAGRAGVKAAGVVIDDAAVTPGYVTGLSPERELPIIRRIATGSLVNKLLILLPAALLLSAFAPWALTPLLCLGGAYLCFEGAEKVIEKLFHHGHAEAAPAAPDAKALEDKTVKGAVRTDLILSAEIMAIALNDVAASPILTQAVALAIVGVAITVGVYGVVALIVKVDDIGLHLSKRPSKAAQATGRALVAGMPVVMTALTVIGTAAMIWVGGGILIHGLEVYHLTSLPGALHHAAEAAGAASGPASGAVTWIVNAAGAGVVGLLVGGLIAGAVGLLPKKRAAKPH